MICEIKVVCSLSHLGYLLTTWIHLFSAGKLLFTGSCMVSIPTQEMVCEIKVVYSLFHLRYLLTMCIHLFADCKLIHAWLAFQHRRIICKIKVVYSLSTCGTSWPCAFIYFQSVSYFSLVHTSLALQLRRMICEIKVVCSLFHLRNFLTMCIHLFYSGCKLVHAWLAFQHKRMICHIELSCSLFHLRYLNMCIDLFSGGKLLFSCLCMVSIPTQENDLWN